VAARTEVPFHERLVQFWTNHFASLDRQAHLSRDRRRTRERAIRPHVTGHFGELLHAVEQHPAMLAYLDNQSSPGPTRRSRVLPHGAAMVSTKVGINENWRVKSSSCTHSASTAATRNRCHDFARY